MKRSIKSLRATLFLALEGDGLEPGQKSVKPDRRQDRSPAGRSGQTRAFLGCIDASAAAAGLARGIEVTTNEFRQQAKL